MEWKKKKRGVWEGVDPDLEGKAVLKETNQGFIASITVEEKQFDMELMDEREFFSSKKEALKFLKERMERDSY
ncbi:MAG: hypothetical protein SVQ76_00980 [Candidatus Nanohaloarchaea archaeon]|nr:hypothetical protein [Candidatus Nanohaloarchaea archaeon]